MMQTIDFKEKGNIQMIAHRGVSGIETENTCEAFIAAGQRSYYGIETDVHLTADGEFIVIHDDDLKRIAGLDMSVENSTFAQLRAVRFSSLDGATKRENLYLPTLDEYVGICKQYDKQCILELKNPMPKEKIWEAMKRIVGLGWLDRTTFISFHEENLLAIREKSPQVSVQFLARDMEEKTIRFMLDNAIDGDLWEYFITPEIVERFHKAGRKVNCYTIDTLESAKRMAECGVDYITTDILE